jgi:dihydrofolate reductase
LTWSLIVAVSDNGIIGNDGELPWRLPADLKFFKEYTTGKTILMGRKTWDSLGRPLPNRRNVVLSRKAELQLSGAEVFHSLDAFRQQSPPLEPVVVIGGAQIYSQALEQDYVREIRLTRVHAVIEGDAYFSALSPKHWELGESLFRAQDERNALNMTFETYQRI